MQEYYGSQIFGSTTSLFQFNNYLFFSHKEIKIINCGLLKLWDNRIKALGMLNGRELHQEQLSAISAIPGLYISTTFYHNTEVCAGHLVHYTWSCPQRVSWAEGWSVSHFIPSPSSYYRCPCTKPLVAFTAVLTLVLCNFQQGLQIQKAK